MSNCRGDGAGYSLFSSARKLGSADACRGGRHPPSWCSSATPIPTPVRLDGGGVLTEVGPPERDKTDGPRGTE